MSFPRSLPRAGLALVALSSFAGAAETATSADAPPPKAADDGRVMIVTADRREGDAERSTASVAVVDQAEIRVRSYPENVFDLLRGIAGVSVIAGNGGVDGGAASIRIRGTADQETQVLLDGIPFNDPAGTQGNPNLSFLNGAGLTRIEVVKGAQSGLYGSRAVGGVINLLSARPTDEAHGAVRLEGGSYRTASLAAEFTGPLSPTFGYAFGVSALDSQGFSAATDPGANGDPRGHEPDSVHRLGINGRVEAKLPAGKLYLSANAVVENQDFDDFNQNTFLTDPDDRSAYDTLRNWRLAGGGESALNKNLRLAGDAAYTVYDRSFPNAVTGAFGALEKDFTSEESYAALRLSWLGFADDVITLGGDGRRQHARIVDTDGAEVVDAADWLGGIWLQDLHHAEDYELSLVLRQDFHSRAGDASTFRAGGAYFFADQRLKLHGAVGTGFRAPSLFELHNRSAFATGNPDLKPEDSTSYELGFEVKLGEQARLASTGFRTDYHDKINVAPVAPFVFAYANLPSASRVEGIENTLTMVTADKAVTLQLLYTWQHSDDGTGQPLLFTPEQQVQVSAAHQWPRGWLRVAVDVVSGDIGFDAVTFARKRLAGYTVVSASAGWVIAPGYELHLRIDNAADAQYQVNDGFATAGRSAYVGLTASY